jgi:hypothetical protein
MLGENTWGGHFGHFHNMYVLYISIKRVAFNLGFFFGIWAWYFDFHKFNDV